MSANKILPFRFWCQKVLPLIYDDSLSYLEVLCKVTAKLNELIKSDNQQGDAIQELQTAVQELIESESTVEEDIASLKDRMTGAEGDIEHINTVIGGINDALEAMYQRVTFLSANFASEYSETSFYNVGAYCIYNNEMYRCVEDIENPSGEFDPSKWQSTNTGIELIRLHDECSNIRIAFDGLVHNVMGSLAPQFRNYEGETVTYLEGDLVTDYQWLYKCILGYSFSSEVEPPSNDPTHWQMTTIAENLSGGGGGGGGAADTVPDWDENTEYYMFDFVTYNDVIYMMTGSAVIGTFDPNAWTAINPNKMITNNQVLLNVTRDSEYYGASGYSEGELCVHFDSDNSEGLYKAYRSTSGVWTPTDWGSTDLVSEFIKVSRYMWGFGVKTYDDTKTYNTGDIVIDYTGRCCVCKHDNVTGTFDYSDWDFTNMFVELAKIIKTVNTVGFYNETQVDRVSDSIVSQ